MKVQRIYFPDISRSSWIVLDNNYLPIKPILSFLKYQEDLGRSPHTVRASTHHLKLFWEFLQDEHLDWKDVDIAHLAEFISWLRCPKSNLVSIDTHKMQRTDATIDQILTAVHVFYEFHIRMKSVQDLPLYQNLMIPNLHYKPFLYGITKSRPMKTRVVKVKPERKLAKTLRHEQVQQILDACSNTRDRFLLILLYETGMRIGQALGLRHEDIKPENNEIHIVPRDYNTNGARAKTRKAYAVPGISTDLMQLYTDYLIKDLNALETDHLPDYVFVNLWEGEIGRPMTYEAVMSLIRRLRKKTGVPITPHMLRHTRATEWIRDDKLPLSTVSQLLGHASIQTTHDIYVHLTPEDLRKERESVRKRRSKEDTHE